MAHFIHNYIVLLTVKIGSNNIVVFLTIYFRASRVMF